MLTEWADSPVETLMIKFKEITAGVKNMLLTEDRQVLQRMLAEVIEHGAVREYWFMNVAVPKETMEYPAWINATPGKNQKDPWTLPQSVVETGHMRGALYGYNFGDPILTSDDVLRIFAITQGLYHTLMIPPSSL